MADGEGVELAPLKGKVVLDLTQFAEAMDDIRDKAKSTIQSITRTSTTATKAVEKLKNVMKEIHEESDIPIKHHY